MSDPLYTSVKDPTVFIDEGHRNFHTKDGRYQPFASVLEADGCRVVTRHNKFELDSLEQVDILVIANALPPLESSNRTRTSSAFEQSEIETLVSWVQ